MKAFLDTSVLVAAFYAHDHRHRSSLDLLVRNGKSNACCGVHNLAETYATLTGMPGRHRVSADRALLFLEDVRAHLTLIVLQEAEYVHVLRSAAETGLVGGAIYDALLGRCALKAGAEAIYTWNEKDFRRLGSEIAERVRSPMD